MNKIRILSVEKRDISNLYELWNKEYEFIYPINKELWERNISNLNRSLSYVALEDEKVIGFLIGKTWQDKFEIKSYIHSAWISIMYVSPNYRKQGVGTSLLNLFEEKVKQLDIDVIHVGKDYKNFFPGIPVDLANFVNWFKKREYVVEGQTYDLVRTTKSLDKLPVENKEFTFRLGSLKDKDNIINFIGRIWPGRWQKEAIDYFDDGGTGEDYLICLNKNEEICGFSKVCNQYTSTNRMSFSLTWRSRFKALGGVGPLGVDPDYRKHHLGYDIVSSAVNVLIDKGVSDIIIDWTSLLEFYRHMGFEVWKSYFYVSKNLN